MYYSINVGSFVLGLFRDLRRMCLGETSQILFRISSSISLENGKLVDKKYFQTLNASFRLEQGWWILQLLRKSG